MEAVSVSRGADGTLQVVLCGEIDYANSAWAIETIRAAVADDPPEAVRVEMAEVTFLDSSGIGVLVYAMRAAREVAADYRVEHPNPKVLDQLRRAGLLEAFGLAEPSTGG